MSDLIKRFIAFLLPILGKAALQTTADVITNIAYPDKKVRTRSGARYNYYAPRTAVEQDEKHDSLTYEDLYKQKDRYHDVLMVAFDITGPNMHAVHEWLYNNMPSPTNPDDEIYLDAWWIADDDAPENDCDSAVFVRKGDQASAREYLRDGGYTNN